MDFEKLHVGLEVAEPRNFFSVAFILTAVLVFFHHSGFAGFFKKKKNTNHNGMILVSYGILKSAG